MEIDINKDLNFSGSKEETIFSSAKKSGITIAHSCLNGRCSECKVKVLHGEFAMPENQEGLDVREINEGYCLSCITKPLSNLILTEVDYFQGVLPQVKTIPAKISRLDFLSSNVVRVNLRFPPNKSLDFIAGQYIDLSFGDVKRSYSITSTPNDKNIELLIKYYPNGKFSKYLFEDAKVNDLLRIEGPKGTYFLPDFSGKLIFISTGTGIAPNLSILNDALNKSKVNPKNVTLIHGQQYVNQHVYNLKESLSGVRVIEAVSKERENGFFHGYVQDALLSLKYNLEDAMIFACGNPRMINDAKKVLVKEGLNKSNFKSDIFVPSN